MISYCIRCLMPSTRPRIQFSDSGACNACIWADEKPEVNWDARREELRSLCSRYRKKSGYDVIVPYSGGKNGAYIAYKLKNEYGMNPLCVTIRPPMEDPIGEQNIKNFISKGFSHLFVSPDPIVEKALDKHEFINKGIPMHAFMIAVQTAILRVSVAMDIPFVMYAEEGESEYGGSTELKNSPTYDIDHGKKYYLSGTDPNSFRDLYPDLNLYWHTYPERHILELFKPEVCHWSYFENFVNYEHYLLAKEKLGLIERETRNIGAIENFSATDTNLIHLYFYLMYLKFGFGRTTSEVGNEIRRGAMTRDQAKTLVNAFDGEFPSAHLNSYLEYYEMTNSEFQEILDKWANKKLFTKVNGLWKPNFQVS
jgi:N-acetyl sugar amidotransferase